MSKRPGGRRPEKARFIVRELDPGDLTIPDHVDRVAAKSLIEIAYQLDADIAPWGWDQPTALLTVRERSRRDTLTGSMLYVETMSIPGFHDLLLASQRQTGRVHPAILECAHRWEDMVGKLPEGTAALVGREVLAVALVNEAWTLEADLKRDPDSAEEVRRVSKAREIHKHPDRVEMRVVSLCGRDDLRVGLMHPRDGVPQHLVCAGTDVPGEKDGSGVLRGDVYDALGFLHRTMELGKMPMTYKDWVAQYPDPDLPEP